MDMLKPALCLFLLVAAAYGVREERGARRAVQLVDQTNDIQKRHPDELDVVLKSDDGNDIRLRLRRTAAPEFLTDDGNGNVQEFEVRGLDDIAFYKVRGNRGVVTSESVEQEPGVFKRSLSGSFIQDDTAYAIESSSQSDKVDNIRGLVDDNTHYVIKRFDIEESMKGDRARRQWPRTRKVIYGVEVYLVIDQGIYERYLTEHRNIDALAMVDIRRYFANIMTGVDVRYGNLEDPAFSIEVRTQGIYVCKNDACNAFSPTNQTTLDSDAVLADIRTWCKANDSTDFLERSDMVLLFTGKNLYSRYRDHSGAIHRSYDTLALAPLSEICSDRSYAVSEDVGMYLSEFYITHELGHTLGVNNHDGSGAMSTCPGSKHNIMTANDGYNEVNALNPYIFSSCAIKLIKDHLNGLTDNCLLEFRGVPRDMANWVRPASEMPGQFLDIDGQCAGDHGDGFTAKLPDNHDEVCAGVECVKGQDTKSKSFYPLRGTSCGNRKWCQMGSCVNDRNAPAYRPNPNGGDRRPNPDTGNQIPDPNTDNQRPPPQNNGGGSCRRDNANGLDGRSCASSIGRAVSRCYEPDVYNKCCATCDSVKFTNSKTGCEWGDQHSTCSRIRTSECSQPRYYWECLCDRCSRVQKAQVSSRGCSDSRGDSRCPDVQNDKSKCYDREVIHYCCASCLDKADVDHPACLFGDKMTYSWEDSRRRRRTCADIQRNSRLAQRQCRKNALVRENCCETCARF